MSISVASEGAAAMLSGNATMQVSAPCVACSLCRRAEHEYILLPSLARES